MRVVRGLSPQELKHELLKAAIIASVMAFIPTMALTQELASVDNYTLKGSVIKTEGVSSVSSSGKALLKGNPHSGVSHKRVVRWLGGRQAVVNIITINPKEQNLVIKPSYGSYKLNVTRRVKDIANAEKAVAGINASYFKPDTGVPLGASVVNGEILTGPLYQRVVFGINADNTFKMDKLEIQGEIRITENIVLPLYNINQPVFSLSGFSVFTDRWGAYTPKTTHYFCHIAVSEGKIQYIKQSSIPIPKGGFVVVGPRSKLPKDKIKQFDHLSYWAKLSPEDWNSVKYVVGGGPYLVKDGKIFIDRQRFSDNILWAKNPRTAIGYTKSGILILVTVDGRQEGSSGATLPELAKLMLELGAYNAMNFDGGSSTQMVYKSKVVNRPLAAGGARVANALLVVPKSADSIAHNSLE